MPRYQYVKIPGHLHPATLSYEVITQPYDSSLMMVVGISICHNKDRFSKRLGKKISDERRENSPHYVGFVNLDPSVSFGRRIVGSIHAWLDSNWESLIKNP